jgi:hypothetical protein
VDDVRTVAGRAAKSFQFLASQESLAGHSLNLSIPRAGLVPSGTIPERPAKAYMLPINRQHAIGLKRRTGKRRVQPADLWSQSLSAYVVSRAAFTIRSRMSP